MFNDSAFLIKVNDINFENMSNDDAVRVLREIVHKPGSVADMNTFSLTFPTSCSQCEMSGQLTMMMMVVMTCLSLSQTHHPDSGQVLGPVTSGLLHTPSQ